MYNMEKYTQMENQGKLDLPVHRTSFIFFSNNCTICIIQNFGILEFMTYVETG